MRYTFIAGVGHGYLKVPFRDAKMFKILDKISEYSFISPSGAYLYLEEDCDAGLFIGAWKDANPGDKFEYDYESLDHEAPCKKYERWTNAH